MSESYKSSDELYTQAVDAARAGNREFAREKLEKLLETDEENVKAWLLLSRVSDTYEERRICLVTVLQLDPGNTRAQDMLDKLEERIAERDVDEVIPGISRRTFNLFAGSVAAVVVLGIIIVAAVIISSNRSQASRDESATIQARTATAFPLLQTQGAIGGTQTQIARVSPTPTATSTSELPPTATPTATITGMPTLEPPLNVPGTILGWSGFDVLSVDYLPIVRYNLAEGGAPEPIGDDILGRYVTSVDGQRIIFMEYRQSVSEEVIVELNPPQTEDGNPATSTLNFLWTTTDFVEDPDMVSVSPDGRFIVFTAGISTTNSRELMLFELPTTFTEDTEASETEAGEAPSGPSLELIRLTNDSANYAYPVMSPDGTHIAVVRTLTEGDTPGTDIVLINVQDRTQVELTRDRDAVVEAMIRWHPNGQEIIYAYNTPDNRNHSIGSVSADGAGRSYSMTDIAEEDQIYPVMSPDGRYLAYSSNRFGGYDLFILEFNTQQLFQVTNSVREEDYASAWLP
ncbi:MAG: hypothetical protein RLP44_12085 [Aggregatilineales bacterium]